MTESSAPSCRILVADDEQPILDLFQQILAPESDLDQSVKDLAGQLFDRDAPRAHPRYELTLCSQGEEAVAAVDKALREENPYCVIFLDVRMAPGISGVEAAQRIRALDPDVVIVMVTAYSDLDPLDISTLAPPPDKLLYVQKPFHPLEIAQFASSLCAKWGVERQLKGLTAELEDRVRERTEDLRRAMDKMTASEARYRTIFEHTGTATMIIENDTMISMVNARLEELSGYPREEIEGKRSWVEFAHPEDLPRMRGYHKARRREPGSAPEEYDFRFLTKTGEVRHVHATVGMLPDGERSVLSVQDVTEHVRNVQRLREESLYDKLTGLPNRALFLDRLDHCMKMHERRKTCCFAVLFLDLDRFKIINETLGLAQGDVFLSRVANRLKRTVRAGETLARFGGDEFAVLMEETRDIQDPVHLANRIRAEFSTPIQMENKDILTTASVGVVLSTGEYQSPEQVISDADVAMYRAKSEGGDKHVVFSQDMSGQAEHQLTLETDLRKALVENQMLALYQPIVRLKDMQVSGFEALIRWRHPERGIITPLEFIPAAEDTGLVTEMDIWMLGQAAGNLAQWRTLNESNRGLTMAVNLSGRDLQRPELLKAIRSAIKDNGLEPGCLHLEITESTLMQAGDPGAETLNTLRALSMKLSVDDFGTGYSSLASLKSHPIDSLKIDRSFVTDMESSTESMEIVRTIVALAHLLGLEVIAEGVEAREHLDILRKLGCDFGQGYLFSRPMEAGDAAELVARGLDFKGMIED